jgi:uncharacterized protein
MAYANLATAGLRSLCDQHGIDASHGIDHALAVLRHLDAAIEESSIEIGEKRLVAMRLAALLHDADDKKYFGKPKDGVKCVNARKIMSDAGASQEIVEDAVGMIELVSCSANGNSCPPEAQVHPELLWPRWADRLEAVGEIGVARCYAYNKHEGTTPLSSEGTPRVTTAAEVLALATPERFEAYQASGGGSASMLDHYYDKLLQVARPPPERVRNAYLERTALAGAEPLISICISYGETGEVPKKKIEEIAARHGILV